MTEITVQPQVEVPFMSDLKPRTAFKLGASMSAILAPPPSQSGTLFSPTGIRAMLTSPQPAELVVRVDPEARIADDIRHLGGNMTRDQGPVRSIVLPTKTVREACGISAIQTMRPARRLAPKLDEVARMHHLERYRKGLPENKRKGEGVIIGIVDTGVNGTHPAFGNRLLECWDQTVKGKGAGSFDYGALLKPAQSVDKSGHGTHVAGIAAGEDAQFCGVAPRANIIAVRTNFSQGQVQDAISYIFERARERHVPAVVNLSLGGHGDPHDGTDDLDLHIDFESGEGQIVVAAAGNEGGDAIHTQMNLDKGEESVVGFRIPPMSDRISLNVWYSGGEAEIAVSHPAEGSTPFQGPLDTEPTFRLYQVGRAGRVNLNTPPRNVVNGDHEVRITIESANTLEPGRWFLHVRAITAPIELHAWSIDESGTGAEVAFSTPVNSHLIGSPGAATSAITASAYVSKNAWVTSDGSPQMTPYPLETLVPFSSPGPLRGNRTEKPDFAMAGEKIASCRSLNAQYGPSQILDNLHVVMGGTSMACAVLSGIVATMLEEHPKWQYGDVVAALKPLSRGTYLPIDGYGPITLL